MPITVNHLATSFDLTDLTTYTTASVSPGNNRLVLAYVYSEAGSLPNVPTLTGNGATRVQVATTTIAGVARFTLFRSLSASPSPGTVSIDFAGQTQFHCLWSMADFDGVATGGANGSAAIVQSATNTTAGATSLTVTLGAFADAHNATSGGFVISPAEALTVGTGFSLVGTVQGPPTIGSEWRVDNDSTVDMSWTTNTGALGIAVELAAAATDVPGGWSLYRPYTLGSAVAALTAGGLFYYWRRRKQERPDE